MRWLATSVDDRARPKHPGHRPQDRRHRQELDQPGLPVRQNRRRGRRQGAVSQVQRPRRDRVADAAHRGRAGAGTAHRTSRQRGRERDPDLLFRCRQGQRRHRRRRCARRGGHDLRQRCARLEALRFLWRGRREDGSGGDGGTGQADGRQRIDRDPRGQPERAQPPQARRGREAGGREVTPASKSSTPSTTSKRRRMRRPKSSASRTRIRRFKAGP